MNEKESMCAVLFAAAATFSAIAEPTGPYLSYLGSNVGKNGNAELSNFIGAEAGASVYNATRSGFYGVRSGSYSHDLYGVNAIGFWSLAYANLMTNVLAVGTSSAREAHDDENSVFIGANAGRNAYFANDSVFIGADAGRRAYYVKDGLFVGAGAGEGIQYVTGRVDVCDLIYADRASGDFRIGNPGAGLSFADGELRIGGAVIAETQTSIPFDFDLCLSPSGDDANDGLTLHTAKRTLAGAIAAANSNGGTNLIVAVMPGDYVPPYADFGANNAIVFRAVGEKSATRIVGGTNAVCAISSATCKWHGFTFTRFEGVGADSQDGFPICRFGGMRFSDCDFLGNEYYAEQGYQAINSCSFSDCTMRDCTFNANTRAYVAYGCVMTDCTFERSKIEFRVNGVDMNGSPDEACRPKFPLGNIVANDTLFRVDSINFRDVSSASNHQYFTNCTFIVEKSLFPTADNYFQWDNVTQIPTRHPPVNCFFVIDGLLAPDESRTYKYTGATGVVSGLSWRVDGSYVAVSNANLTADGVAADADCPSVRDDGLPDYGYKSSGLGAAKTALALKTNLAAVATSGSYTNLTDTPTIPSKVSDLTNDAGYVTAETESDPKFSAWKDGTSVAAGFGAYAATSPDDYFLTTAIGAYSKANGEQSTALGTAARADAYESVAVGCAAYVKPEWEYAISFSQSPGNIYLSASEADLCASARTLQSYLDERAVRYTFAAPTDAAIAAADGTLYSVSADTNGVSVTLPAAATYSQDFVIRLAPADTNGTCLAAISGAATDSTAWQFDYPTGTNAVFGTIYAPTYYTFTQTAADRWSVFTYAATKEEE